MFSTLHRLQWGDPFNGGSDLGVPGCAAEGTDGAQAGCPSAGSGTRHLCSDIDPSLVAVQSDTWRQEIPL